eukprot:m.75434 g.75434  ORF g.75434 m.75434 type:complete len:72 (+) comp12451_c0_seq2:3304-3519(+)
MFDVALFLRVFEENFFTVASSTISSTLAVLNTELVFVGTRRIKARVLAVGKVESGSVCPRNTCSKRLKILI